MVNFKVPDNFTAFLKEEINSGVIDKARIDLRSFFQYAIDHSARILYNTEFEKEVPEEIIKYLVLLYGGQEFVGSDYIKSNMVRIVEAVLRLVQDLNMQYSGELFSCGKFPLVLNASPGFFTVEYKEPENKN